MPAANPIPRSERTPAAISGPAMAAGPASLRAVLAFTFLNSIGSAVVYAGIFFLARHEYGFTERMNFLLALLYGLTYIPAAYFAGAAVRRIARLGISPRGVLVFMMLAMAGLAWLPVAAAARHGSGPGSGPGPSWPLWIAVGLYSPLSGAMWPIVESFLAGGRSDAGLRSAIGKFNIAWSSALVATLIAIGPLVEHHALIVLGVLGLIHLSGIAPLLKFSRAPGAHADHHAAASEHYRRLLSVFRLLLPTSFMFISTLSPYLPGALDRLGVPVAWGTVVTSVWYAARVATFFTMERWHGWHGRWSTPVLGGIVLITGFGLIILAPLAGGAPGLTMFLLGLSGFGIGVGVIYASALYYAMEVGSAGVDAGGIHETVIGIGYSTGPICGLAATALVSGGTVPQSRFEVAMLAMVVGAALVVAVVAIRLVRAGMASSAIAAPDSR